MIGPLEIDGKALETLVAGMTLHEKRAFHAVENPTTEPTSLEIYFAGPEQSSDDLLNELEFIPDDWEVIDMGSISLVDQNPPTVQLSGDLLPSELIPDQLARFNRRMQIEDVVEEIGAIVGIYLRRDRKPPLHTV